MKHFKRAILCFILITILDPYKAIKYGRIDVYDYSQRNRIEVYEPEKEVESSNSQVETKRYWCFICEPQQWIFVDNFVDE